jgi:hypothetical protein
MFALLAIQPIVLALEAEYHVARSTAEPIFITFKAEFFVALGTVEHFCVLAASDFLQTLQFQIAEKTPLGKVVTLYAANPANLGHFAVSTTRANSWQSHTSLFKSRSMVFAKATT